MVKTLPEVNLREHQDNAPRIELNQRVLDDSKDESLAVANILHRFNNLYMMINSRNHGDPKNKLSRESWSVSISREAKHILVLLDDFKVMKLKHCEAQHTILKKLTKNLKRYV